MERISSMNGKELLSELKTYKPYKNQSDNNGVFYDKLYVQNYDTYAKIYVRDHISSIMVYSENYVGKIDFKKSWINPKYLTLQAENIVYCGYITKLVNIDFLKPGYYRTSLPLYLTFKI